MRKEFFLYTIMIVTIVGLTATDAWASPPRAPTPTEVCIKNGTTRKVTDKYAQSTDVQVHLNTGNVNVDSHRITQGNTVCIDTTGTKPEYYTQKFMGRNGWWGVWAQYKVLDVPSQLCTIKDGGFTRVPGPTNCVKK